MTNNTLGPSKQILYADGHQDTCSLVSYLLKPFGYKVTTVNDMSNGLRIARAVNYDLYMIACKLSDGTGVELCEKLREFDRETPILFWSARVYESDRQRALGAGANFFLRKPCEYDAIPTTICQLIDQSQQLQANHFDPFGFVGLDQKIVFHNDSICLMFIGLSIAIKPELKSYNVLFGQFHS